MKFQVSILAALVTILAIVGQNGPANAGDVADLIQSYFKCEHLKSSPADSFYKSKGLANMDFEQAMSFIRKIYTDTKNCDSDYCKCVDGFIDDYSILFRSESSFLGLKSILEAFNNKYNTKPYWKSLRESFKNVKEGEKYPTIVQFLMKYEYTSNKLNFYNNISDCDVGLANPEVRLEIYDFFFFLE